MAGTAPNMSVVDGLADPIFLIDQHGRIAYMNRACERAFGVEACEAMDRTMTELPGLELDEGLVALLSAPPKRGIPASLAAVRIGAHLWDVRVTPTAEDLTAVYCVPSSGMRSSWPEWVADSADAIWALDKNERIVAWNRGAEELLGYTADEIIGERMTRLIPPDLIAEREPERLRKALRELGAVRDYQTRRVTKDGREIEVSLTRTVTRNGGADVASSTIVRDLSQRRQVERQVVESEKLVTVGQLAASVAQEIGAPLTTIRIVIENLKSICKAEGHAHETQLETVSQQLNRIAHLTHGLVELAKPGELKISRVQVSRVIEGALELLEPSLRRANVKVDVQTDSEHLKIPADVGQLQQVFLNLLMNAQRALEADGGGCVKVRTELKRGLPSVGHPLRSVVRIELSDDGPGIDPADLHYIFAPFFSRSGGSGLGLALTKQIIHAHGGTIDVQSVAGAGATFIIHLPVETDA